MIPDQTPLSIGTWNLEQAGPGQEIVIRRVSLPTPDTRYAQDEIRVNIDRTKGEANVSIDDRGRLQIKGSQSEIRNMPLNEAFSRSGMWGNIFQDAKWSPKATTTQLGAKEIDGLRVEGKSSSYTIPAGEVGNKNPITVTSETWFSPELQVTVYWKQSDPRSGESIYRLGSVKRSEQPLALFRVPEGYSTRDRKVTGAPVPPAPKINP